MFTHFLMSGAMTFMAHCHDIKERLLGIAVRVVIKTRGSAAVDAGQCFWVWNSANPNGSAYVATGALLAEIGVVDAHPIRPNAFDAAKLAVHVALKYLTAFKTSNCPAFPTVQFLARTRAVNVLDADLLRRLISNWFAAIATGLLRPTLRIQRHTFGGFFLAGLGTIFTGQGFAPSKLKFLATMLAIHSKQSGSVRHFTPPMMMTSMLLQVEQNG
jgi:hypothetical protein